MLDGLRSRNPVYIYANNGANVSAANSGSWTTILSASDVALPDVFDVDVDMAAFK